MQIVTGALNAEKLSKLKGHWHCMWQKKTESGAKHAPSVCIYLRAGIFMDGSAENWFGSTNSCVTPP